MVKREARRKKQGEEWSDHVFQGLFHIIIISNDLEYSIIMIFYQEFER